MPVAKLDVVTRELRGNLTFAVAYRRILFAAILFWAAAASFNGFYRQYQFGESSDRRGDFKAMIDGTASRPFIFRRLVPLTANLVEKLTPQRIKDRLSVMHAQSGKSLYQLFFDSPEALDPAYSYRYLVTYLFIFFMVWVAAGALYKVCRSEGIQRVPALAASVATILVFPYLGSEAFETMYDYPELAFLALAFLVARRCRWWWLIPLVVLGTLNKESFVFFLITLYPVIRPKLSRWKAVSALAFLEAIALCIYLYMRTVYAGNPGGNAEFQAMLQLARLGHISGRIFSVAHFYGVPVPVVDTLIPLGLVTLTIWRAWPRLSLMARRNFQMATVINLPLYFLWGGTGEIRVLSMLFVPAHLCLGWVLSEADASPAARPARHRA